jgi:hypothetical protein
VRIAKITRVWGARDSTNQPAELIGPQKSMNFQMQPTSPADGPGHLLGVNLVGRDGQLA